MKSGARFDGRFAERCAVPSCDLLGRAKACQFPREIREDLRVGAEDLWQEGGSNGVIIKVKLNQTIQRIPGT